MEYTDIELKNEQWRDIDGYDGAYQVSDLGRVRSRKYGDWRVMRPGKDMKGYLNIGLCREGKQKHYKIHRLVAQAFIPNDDETKIYINHIDECKQNNRFWNIEYCTAQYNNTYNDLHRRRKHPKYKRNAIKDLYDPNLSIPKNIEIFRANGIECCDVTVNRLRKDLDLIGTNRKYVRNKIKDLYDPELSINENLEIFKSNGIECNEKTVRNLRKDLNLKGYYPQPKRSKIKDLYDPNLTYRQNLEIFRANGVECSTRVINSIRKDLGLVKSTKKK